MLDSFFFNGPPAANDAPHGEGLRIKLVGIPLRVLYRRLDLTGGLSLT